MHAAGSLQSFDVQEFLSRAGIGKSVLPIAKGAHLYSQGDACDTVFYIRQGSVKLSVVSSFGKEATIALLNPGDFVGEECLSTVQPLRTATATAVTSCTLFRITRLAMTRVLSEQPAMSTLFVAHLLARTSRIQADLVDQLFNSAEKRLARTLLLLANFGKEGVTETLVPVISQETLAAMIGTTRARVNFFLNRFRTLGFVEYGDQIRVHKSLLQVLLHE